MKKIIIITIFIFLLFGFWQNAAGLLLDYPTIKGTTPTSEGLPGLIRYIYLFSLGIVGMVALLSILIGAIKYVTSAGSPDKAKDAKEQITSALLGVLILLASSLILQTINPDLINLGVELTGIPSKGQTTTPQKEGETYACWICGSTYKLLKKACDPKKGTCAEIKISSQPININAACADTALLMFPNPKIIYRSLAVRGSCSDPFEDYACFWCCGEGCDPCNTKSKGKCTEKDMNTTKLQASAICKEIISSECGEKHGASKEVKGVCKNATCVSDVPIQEK